MLAGLIGFLSEDYSQSVITLVVGTFAFFLYKKQKSDEKINAARIIFLEIRNAEVKLDEATSLIDREMKDFPSLLSQNSWNKYSHLFASNFEQSELEEINRFYSNCESLQEMIDKDNNFFWLNAEYRTQVVQSGLFDNIRTNYKEGEEADEKVKRNQEKVKLLDEFVSDWYSYTPSKTLNKIRIGINRTRKVTTNPTGEKLKRFARLGSESWFKIQLASLF
jgi:hypothetical protein